MEYGLESFYNIENSSNGCEILAIKVIPLFQSLNYIDIT